MKQNMTLQLAFNFITVKKYKIFANLNTMLKLLKMMNDLWINQ